MRMCRLVSLISSETSTFTCVQESYRWQAVWLRPLFSPWSRYEAVVFLGPDTTLSSKAPVTVDAKRAKLIACWLGLVCVRSKKTAEYFPQISNYSFNYQRKRTLAVTQTVTCLFGIPKRKLQSVFLFTFTVQTGLSEVWDCEDSETSCLDDEDVESSAACLYIRNIKR